MNETLSHEKKALSAKAIEKMKSGDKDKSDIGENVGLSCSYNKTVNKSLLLLTTVLITFELIYFYSSS